MRFWAIAFFNLQRRPLRTVLTALGIAVAVGSFVAMIGLSRGLERAWEGNLKARGTHVVAMQKGAINLFATSIDLAEGERIGRVEGVQAVAGELADMMALESEQTIVAIGWPLDSYLWTTLKVVQGTLPPRGDPAAVLLGETSAEALGKRPGDRLTVRDRTFTVSGTFRMESAVANNTVILPLPTMQDLMQRQGKVTMFNIRVDRPDDAARVAAVISRLQQAFPGLTFLELRSVADNDQIIRLFRAIAWSVSAIAIVIALVVVLNTLLMSVLERTREIGILSAVGWGQGRIMALFVLEGLALALIGGSAGLALGTGGLHWLTNLPRLRGMLEAEIGWTLLGDVIGATLVLGILGSLYPAWRASRLNTVDTLRYE